jgi:hypothetical protein
MRIVELDLGIRETRKVDGWLERRNVIPLLYWMTIILP